MSLPEIGRELNAVQEKAFGLFLLRVHPRLDPIRSDPRYWPLVERVGLGDA